MTRVVWKAGAHESGLDRGVLYPAVGTPVPWNGLISIDEGSDADLEDVYFDGVKVNLMATNEDFVATAEAFTYPDAFEACLAPKHEIFGLSYRVETHNGYLIHLVYNATAKLNSREYITRGQDRQATPFAWDIFTRPSNIVGVKPSAHLVINSSVVKPSVLALLEDSLYGSATGAPFLPSAQAILDIFQADPWVKITDLGDGTFTIEGPEELVRQVDATTFDIETGGYEYVDAESYTLTSW